MTIPAYYIHTRYMLTGEVIPYSRQNGVFGRITPLNPVDFCKGHWGAWELASQVSFIDLNPLFGQPGVDQVTNAPITIAPARRMTNYTFGMNWYIHQRAKIVVDYILTDLNDPIRGDSYTHTFAGRAQFDF